MKNCEQIKTNKNNQKTVLNNQKDLNTMQEKKTHTHTHLQRTKKKKNLRLLISWKPPPTPKTSGFFFFEVLEFGVSQERVLIFFCVFFDLLFFFLRVFSEAKFAFRKQHLLFGKQFCQRKQAEDLLSFCISLLNICHCTLSCCSMLNRRHSDSDRGFSELFGVLNWPSAWRM